MKIGFYCIGEIEDSQLAFAVIAATCEGQWVFVKHRERETWEIPGGHREENEAIDLAASRELYEETGAVSYRIEPICDYSVTRDGEAPSYGRLFFSEIKELGKLPESEIHEVRRMKRLPGRLTYPQIQPELYKRVLEYLGQKVLQCLEKDKARNINIINFMKSYPIDSISKEGESVLVRGKSDENWVYISSESLQEFQKLIQGLDEEDTCFAVLEDWMLPAIAGDREIRSRLTSMKLVFDETVPLPDSRHDCVPLVVSDASHIYENSKYKEYTSIEYIEERIVKGVGYGIREEGKLVAWALTHDDGAMGFLHVLEEYRERGYARDVSVAMIRRLLEMGEVPYVHIEEDNERSMNLSLKTGFRKDRRVHWIKLK